VRPRVYSSTVAFVPQGRATPSNISGIAAQLGLALPAAGGTQSPAFYIELLGSRAVLRDALLTEYTVPTDTGTIRANLVDLWELEEETPALRVEAGLERLAGSVEASSSGQTGVVRLTARARQPELARQIADRLVTLLNDFNLGSRRSQATAEREFVERRLADVGADLRAAENRLQAFLQQNRVTASPALRFEEERLNRAVSLQTQLYTTLAQAFEQAKIDEVRDTPVITVVEPAETPARPDRRGLLRTGVVALLGGLALGLVLAFLAELAAQYRRQRAAAAAGTGTTDPQGAPGARSGVPALRETR